MPEIILALMSALASAAATLTGRVLIALGIQYVSYRGFDVLLQQIIGFASGGVTGLPAQVMIYIGFLRLDEAMSIISGAITARFGLNGLADGSITRMIIR